MSSYIPFPNISPEIFSVTLWGFSFALRWYAVAYITGLLLGWRDRAGVDPGRPPLARRRGADVRETGRRPADLGDPRRRPGRAAGLSCCSTTWPHYLAHPLSILEVWQGGMSFHGGFLGVTLAAVLYCRSQKIPLLSVADLLAVAAPQGLMLGRLANFINAELWGLPSHLPWAVAFPGRAAQDCGPGLADDLHPPPLAALRGGDGGADPWPAPAVFLAWRRGWLRRPGS